MQEAKELILTCNDIKGCREMVHTEKEFKAYRALMAWCKAPGAVLDVRNNLSFRSPLRNSEERTYRVCTINLNTGKVTNDDEVVRGLPEKVDSEMLAFIQCVCWNYIFLKMPTYT
jgi:hypothetical protein